jgi:hypothetical protein
MIDFQERVVTEKSDLDEKINKLNKFIGTPVCDDLEAEERLRLLRQLETMHTYSNLLNERINSFWTCITNKLRSLRNECF